MNSSDIPYIIVGVSLNEQEQQELREECERTGEDRSSVIKRALMYWISLDQRTKDEVIIRPRAARF